MLSIGPGLVVWAILTAAIIALIVFVVVRVLVYSARRPRERA